LEPMKEWSEAHPCILALYIFFTVVSQGHTFELDLIIQKPATHRMVEGSLWRRVEFLLNVMRQYQ
jgi:hypothetical protein